MLLATTLVTSIVFAAPALDIGEVSPEQTVVVMSVDDLGAMLTRIEDSPGGRHLTKLDEMKEMVGDGLQEPLGGSWRDMMEDKSMTEVLGSLRMGLAAFPVIDAETTAVSMGFSLFVGLGDLEAMVDETWSDAMERMEESESSFEILELSDVEVVRLTPGEDGVEDDMDEDPFGGGGGLMGGMSLTDALPERIYLAHHEGHVLVTTSRTQMQRMIDLLNGDDVEGGLNRSESWEGVSEFIGTSGIRVMLLTDHLGEMAKSLGQPFLVDMAKPMVSAMLGRIDGIGFAVTAAEAPALATYRMGVFMPEGKSGLMKLLARNAPREAIPGWVAADATSFGRMTFDTAGVLPWMKSVINSNPMMAMQANQMMEQVEPMMEKLMAGMGDTVFMASSISYPLTADSNQSLFAIAAKNGKEFTDALAEMGPQMGMEPRDFQGHQIYSMSAPGVPGMSIPEIGIAVGGDQIFAGNMSAVEQALRSIGQRGADQGSADTDFSTMDAMFSSEPVAMWSVAKMGETMRASSEITQMQTKAQLAEIEAEDPEFAAELAELFEEDDTEAKRMIDLISQIIGMVGYEVISVDQGFRLNGWVLPVAE